MELLKEKINRALDKVKLNEQKIIANNISERAITHKLAEYLQIEFPDYNVDCEYNRNSDFGPNKPKYLDIYEYNQKRIKNLKDVSMFKDQVSTYPDIIVHKRFSNEKNYLIIEVKKDNNVSDWDIDTYKLEGFTSSTDTNGYGFKFGLHITFFVEEKWRQPNLEWYKNGEITNSTEVDNCSCTEKI